MNENREKKDIFSSNGIIFLFFILSMPFHFRLQCSSEEWTFISLYDSKESYIKPEKGQFWYQRISMSLPDGHEIQMCLIFFLYEVLFSFCVREKTYSLGNRLCPDTFFLSSHLTSISFHFKFFLTFFSLISLCTKRIPLMN